MGPDLFKYTPLPPVTVRISVSASLKVLSLRADVSQNEAAYAIISAPSHVFYDTVLQVEQSNIPNSFNVSIVSLIYASKCEIYDLNSECIPLIERLPVLLSARGH